ncbi:unnamed protein product [Lampetra fluviatilis]
MGISLPVCGHGPLTSRWAARCLDAKFNLRCWEQMAAWTRDPDKDGEPLGWAPSRVVHISDGSSDDALGAAAPQWVSQRRLGMRRNCAGMPRAGAEAAGRRAAAMCFKCGCLGHFFLDSPSTLSLGDGSPFCSDNTLHLSRSSAHVNTTTTYGRKNVPPIEVQLATSVKEPPLSLPEHVCELLRRVTEAREAARLAMARTQARNEQYARRSRRDIPWAVGDTAWLHCPQPDPFLPPRMLSLPGTAALSCCAVIKTTPFCRGGRTGIAHAL